MRFDDGDCGEPEFISQELHFRVVFDFAVRVHAFHRRVCLKWRETESREQGRRENRILMDSIELIYYQPKLHCGLGRYTVTGSNCYCFLHSFWNIIQKPKWNCILKCNFTFWKETGSAGSNIGKCSKQEPASTLEVIIPWIIFKKKVF